MADTAVTHDRQLFRALLEAARAIESGVRSGAMFGCPAIFFGRKMAGCVFGSRLALKAPADAAAAAIASGRAAHFTPYGRPKMREWIEVAVAASDLHQIDDLLASAIAFAAANNG